MAQNLDLSVSSELLTELVEHRVLRRLRGSRRRWAATAIALGTLIATITGVVVQWRANKSIEDRIKHETASRETPHIFEDDTPADLLLGSPETIEIRRDGSRSFRVAVPDANTRYQIEARASGSFDPVISLFRIPVAQPTTRPSLVGYNDDFGGSLDSRLVVMLQPDFQYELRVQELFGEPGEVTVSLTEVQPDAP